MRISYTVSSTEILSSGVTHCVNELSKGLKRLGVQTEILSLSNSKFISNNRFERKFKGDFSNIPLIHKAGISHSMKKYVMSSSSDIIHTHGLWMFPNFYRNSHSKFVISPHGMLAQGALKFSTKKKKIINLLFQRYAFADAKLLIATAESELEDIRKFGLKMPIAIIPHGVKIPHIKKNIIQKKIKTAISLGRLHPKKGLDTLIRAGSRIEKIFNNWELKIVGPDEGGYTKILKLLIKELNLERVAIEPAIYGSEKDKLLSKCDIFVLASKSENFALTVAESLAVQVPVIATKNTPWSGLDKNQCGLWVDDDENSLANALATSFKLSNEQLIQMGKRGQNWMKNDFSWDLACRKTKEAYDWVQKKTIKPNFIDM